MARSTTLIALVGGALLVAAVAVAVLRGTEDATPTAQPSPGQTMSAAEDDASPAASDTTSPTATDESSHDDQPSSPQTPTSTETAAPDSGEVAGGEDTDEPADGSATDGDESLALEPTGLEGVQDTPNTGGGQLALLGGAVATVAVATGRRPRG